MKSKLNLKGVDWFIAYAIGIIMGLIFGLAVKSSSISYIGMWFGIVVGLLFLILVLLNAKIENIVLYLKEKEDGKKLLV